MKTEPMTHQVKGCAAMRGREYFAMGAEQGTGKTWMLLADVEELWENNEIDALLVIAPNGVHINWISREIPKHLGVPSNATFWLSGASKKHDAILQRQIRSAISEPRVLQIHAMNVDAINTKAGFAHAERFLLSFPSGKVAMIIDESHTIKNLAAKRTKNALRLGAFAGVRRISSGTLVANSPLDLFSQYEFLAPGLLGTRSYRAFVSEYAEVLSADSPLVQNIIQRTGARGTPQIVAKNRDGTLKFKNLDKLSRLMSPNTFRVLKEECLDLPAKIYQTMFFDLCPEQRAAYNDIKKNRNWERDDGSIDAFTALTVLTKLRQITSGFILVDGEPTELAYGKQRMAALLEIIEAYPGPIIVWAHFQEELRQIAAALRSEGEHVREYHGGTSSADREIAVNDFQNLKARFFVGNPAAAGMGLTLTAASTVVYFSSDFSLSQRVQSEDRCHRIGTTAHVVYIDIVGRDTIDERIASALQSKKLTAEIIMEGL